MKYLVLLPLLLLPACASKKVVVQMPHSVPGTIIPAEDTESIRYAENLKAYTVGRYVEPNDSLVMHERHTVYRVETTPKWNLHPNPAVSIPMGPATGIVDAARREPPVNAEVIAEVNRQKAMTQAVIAQDQRMQAALRELSGAIAASQQTAEQTLRLKEEQTTTAKRLDALERQLRAPPNNSLPTSTNQNDGW
jgi:hypothetical protein